ncbi:TIGR04282 family arsenosugar biosynthesis glycosyltransferase [Glaciibacter flavus]|uniref:TIGR04282 family arsenosugar biosynthesis glycosyltransferase n=1 Tax=Orlajensenia flava TaxID=2565934 RepID=UPI003B00BB23
MTAIVVIAKECLPGRVKTRLHPPLSLEQAAELAAASLDDTIEAVRSIPADRRILFFDGDTPPASADGFEIIPQPAGTLDERLAALFDALDEPTVLVGMDTPQLRPGDVRWPDSGDVVFGPALDGGYWAIGMREPRGDLILGVPMSRADTGAHQLAAIARAGLCVELLPVLHDVDEIADAERVAALAPHTRFARALAAASSEAGAA